MKHLLVLISQAVLGLGALQDTGKGGASVRGTYGVLPDGLLGFCFLLEMSLADTRKKVFFQGHRSCMRPPAL